MKLADWMHRHHLTPRQLRRMLGVNSRTTVSRWVSGERLPTNDFMRRIESMTEGEVTLQDFLDPRPPRCLRRITDRSGRTRIVYPWTVPENHTSPRANNQNERETSTGTTPPPGRPPRPTAAATPDDPWPSPPIRRALDALGRRATADETKGFTLDGRPVDARRLVIEANRVRAKFNLPPIAYPGVARKQ